MDSIKKVTKGFVNQPMGISTGFYSLDEAIWGFTPRTLVMVGGRPSMGKSSLMADLILATSKEVPVGVFSKEMPKEQLPPRLVCNFANLNYHNVRKGKITEEEKDKYFAAVAEVESLPIYVDYDRYLVGTEKYWVERRKKEGFPNVESYIMDLKIKEWVAEKGCKVIFADYLQIFDLLDLSKTQERLKVGKIAYILREYAKKYGITFVLLSQLRRFDVSQGKAPLPTMSDLKESGELEAHADIVMLLHRPEYYRTDRKLELFSSVVEDDAVILMGKNRDGPAGNVDVNFCSYAMSYRDKTDDVTGGF